MENLPEKTEKSPLPVVAIDGPKIKLIRETRKLTQLYVASVVGVTTDTISRWENNRYPAIKRDNAEKLASALEVELTEILRQEELAQVDEEPLRLSKWSKTHYLLLLALVAAALLVTRTVFMSGPQFAVPMAVRKLPRFGAPGEIVPVQLKINRKNATANGLILKERLPEGWRLINSYPLAALGPVDAQEVKWLIPAGTGPLTISYTIRISPTALLQTTTTFAGEIVAPVGGISRKRACGGDLTIIVAGVHWADSNGDGRIDDDEIMPAYYLTEEMKGLGLDWKTIEAIWNGKGYHWDPRTGEFEVLR